MKSMTGFGRGTATVDGITATVEIASINSKRQLELRCSVPRELGLLEQELRALVQKRILRGTVTMTVQYQVSDCGTAGGNAPLNLPVAEQALEALRDFALLHNLPEPRLQELLMIPGVLQESTPDLEKIRAALQPAVETALDALDAMRRAEGENLRKDLDLRRQRMQDALQRIVAREADAVLAMRDRIQERIAALGVEIPVEDERLAREVAFYVDTADITEETVRLHSHLKQYESLLKTDSDAGRNFDFLVQEMSREINTLSSKTADSLISADALDLKIELSKVKEQIANLE